MAVTVDVSVGTGPLQPAAATIKTSAIDALVVNIGFIGVHSLVVISGDPASATHGGRGGSECT